MSRTKLISVRIDEETLVRIDELSKCHKYANRSFVINHILRAVLQCAIGNQLWKLVYCYDPFSEGVKIHITTRDGAPIN